MTLDSLDVQTRFKYGLMLCGVCQTTKLRVVCLKTPALKSKVCHVDSLVVIATLLSGPLLPASAAFDSSLCEKCLIAPSQNILLPFAHTSGQLKLMESS